MNSPPPKRMSVHMPPHSLCRHTHTSPVSSSTLVFALHVIMKDCM